MRSLVVNKFRILAVLAAVLISTASAAVELASPFGDHMVLQRDMPVRIFGTASAGTKVSIEFQGKTAEGTTAADGRWFAMLPPLEAGGPFELNISGGGSNVTRSDVLVGEVWLCAGQSNMGWGVGKCLPDDTRLAAILDSPDLDQLRLRGNKWTVGSKENYAKASALRLAFAYELHKKLQVPVGIIGGSNSGSKASGWLTESMLVEDEELVTAIGMDALKKGMAKPKDKIASNYDSRIRHLEGYTVRGMLWDQGEAGTGMKGVPFPETTKALFRGWRKAWEQEFPVLFISKESGGSPAFDPDNPLTRYSAPYDAKGTEVLEINNFNRKQMKKRLGKVKGDPERAWYPAITSLEGAHMVYVADLQPDIHPTMKADYASRAALVARQAVYGEAILAQGPRYASHSISDGVVVVTFDHVGQGLVTAHGTGLTGFQILDDQGMWWFANAAITSPNQVSVSHPNIAKPQGVRYAWSKKIAYANLYNAAGLPAVLFQVNQ